MQRKYQIASQVTGKQHECETFEEAKTLQLALLKEMADHSGILAITVLTKDEDDLWAHARADDEGNPIVRQVPDLGNFGLDEPQIA